MNTFSKIAECKYIRYSACFVALSLCCNLSAETGSEGSIVLEKSLSEENGHETEKQSENSPDGENVLDNIIETISSTKISDLKKPFSDQHGYIEKIDDFDLTITNKDTDKQFKIKDLRGNVVVVLFMATWCQNCPSVFQDLDKLAEELLPSKKNIPNVKIIPLVIGNDTDNYIRVYYKANNVQLLDVFEPIQSPGTESVKGVPACIVFNKQGIPVWGFAGIANYRSQEFLDFIEALSKED